jgi:hypothetical protein
VSGRPIRLSIAAEITSGAFLEGWGNDPADLRDAVIDRLGTLYGDDVDGGRAYAVTVRDVTIDAGAALADAVTTLDRLIDKAICNAIATNVPPLADVPSTLADVRDLLARLAGIPR